MTESVPMNLTIDSSGQWCLAATRDKVYKLRAEYSRSGKARCRGCNDFIESKSVRIGKPVKWRGLITSWMHLKCFYIAENDTYITSEAIKSEEVHGIEKLEKKDQKEVGVAAQRRSPPKHLITFAADDDEDKGTSFGTEREIDLLEPSDLLTIDLLPFQIEGFSWMVGQEASDIKGGILADQMGMGKTIQAISLLLHQKKHAKSHLPSLVVCPASALYQWQEELSRCTKNGALSVFVFHGNTKSLLTPAELLSHDVVLATFSTVESGYRKAINSMKVACKYCSKMFVPSKLKFHNKFFCGPNAMRSRKHMKTEKNSTMKKAMESLKITSNSSFPTPSNVYREIMTASKRVPVSMYSTKSEAKKAQMEDEDPESDVESEQEGEVNLDGYVLWTSDDGKISIIRPVFVQKAFQKKHDFNENSFFSNIKEEGFCLKFEAVGSKSDEDYLVLRSTPWKGQNGVVDVKIRVGKDQKKKTKLEISFGKEWKEKAKGKWTPAGEENGFVPEAFIYGSEAGVISAKGKEKGKVTYFGSTTNGKEVKFDCFEKKKFCGPEEMKLFCEGKIQKEIDVKKENPKKNVKKEAKKVVKKSKGSESDEDSEFVASGSEDDEEEDDSSFSEASDEEEESEEEEDEDGLKESFIPVNWGEGSSEFEDMLDALKPNNKRKKKPKKRPSKKQQPKGKSLSDSDDSESEYSESEEERKEKRQFRYAKEEQIVDGTGMDLGLSLLHCVAWRRIIIDEAHKIKDRTNSTAKSIFALRGEDEATDGREQTEKETCFRWCLTGTPLQNRVGELYALVRFLKIEPYAFYGCSAKDCQCHSLHWNFGKNYTKCVDCGHPSMRHFSYFNKKILNPINRNGMIGEGGKAMKLLREEVLFKSMLRRTKEERKSDLKLPKLNIGVIKLQLSDAEKDFYHAMHQQTRAKFDTYVDKGTLLHNYAHVFELLSRLRRTVDHPYLVIHGKNASNDAEFEAREEEIPTESKGGSDVCAICNNDIEELKEVALAKCQHTFHRACVTKLMVANQKQHVVSECPKCYQPLTVMLGVNSGQDSDETKEEDDDLCVICFENKKNALLMDCGHMYTCVHCAKNLKQKMCPMCRSPIKKIVQAKHFDDHDDEKTRKPALIGRESILQKIALAKFQSSTKLDAVIAELSKIEKMKVEDGRRAHKAIVFSQYTDMLDLLEWRCRSLGIIAVKLVGSMGLAERQAVLKKFRESDEVKVILMSLKAGGEGLNLQQASHVYILDPWWNPQVHNQAFQRAHRIGQTRDVHAYSFVTDDTIESRMHELQQKKELVFQGAVEGNSKSLQQLTEEDLHFLFKS